jgi:hypothetical protein
MAYYSKNIMYDYIDLTDEKEIKRLYERNLNVFSTKRLLDLFIKSNIVLNNLQIQTRNYRVETYTYSRSLLLENLKNPKNFHSFSYRTYPEREKISISYTWPYDNNDRYSSSKKIMLNKSLKQLNNVIELRDRLKAILDTREHIPNKQERKKIRQEKARQNKSGSKSKSR